MKRLEGILKFHQIRKEQLCKQCQLSEEEYKAFLSGDKEITISVVHVIMKWTGVSMDYLLSGRARNRADRKVEKFLSTPLPSKPAVLPKPVAVQPVVVQPMAVQSQPVVVQPVAVQPVTSQTQPVAVQPVAAQAQRDFFDENPIPQYEAYKKPLKKYAIIQLIGAGLSFLLIIFFLFLPVFRIDISNFSIEQLETVSNFPKFNGLHDITFSLFDELQISVNNLFSGGIYYFALIGIEQLMSLIFMVVALVMIIVSIVKNALAMRSLDDYALNTYDKIKTRAEEKKRRYGGYYYSPGYYLGTAIGFQIFVIVFSRFLTGTVTYMRYINGVSGWLALLLPIALAVLVIYIYGSTIHRKIRMGILKDDYHIRTK